MFKMYSSDSHSYTHLILALGIVREPTVWGVFTSQYPNIHDIGRANTTLDRMARGVGVRGHNTVVIPV